MDTFNKEYTLDSNVVLMSLLSEPISCSWIPSEKENSINTSKLVPLVPGIVEKPPSGRKIEESDNFFDTPELRLDLYTIPESGSEEYTERSENDYFTNVTNNNKIICSTSTNNLSSELCLEDIDDDITNINNVEKQTDLILKDLQKEQNQLNEIVSDIDKLFQNESTEVDETEKIKHKSTSKYISAKRPSEKKEKLPNIKPEHDIDVSTYGDIVNILEELEKEDNGSLNSSARSKSSNNDTKEQDKENSKKQTKNKTPYKDYSDLLLYLDEIDESCTNTLNAAKQRVQNITKLSDTHIRLEAIPKLDDLLQLTNIELSNYIIDLTLRLEDKVSSISMLKSEITKLHKLIANNEEDRERKIKQKLADEKNKYEPVIKRHQSFIDQLIVDKKELNDKCEHLMNELKTMEGRHTHNMQAAEQRHKIEIRRCKDMHEAAEKGKREKWMVIKTAKIKELTVKSVEYEINSMNVKYQKELSDIKLSHRNEIEELELKAARKMQQQCEILREQLTKEREHAIANEREALKQRFEKLVESEEKSYQEQKRKVKDDHTTKINLLKNKEIDLEKEKDNAINLVRQECEEKLKISQRRHDIQITNMQESLRLELEMWKNNYLKEQNMKMTDIESKIRETYKKERDREIELVIDKLERESEKSKREIEVSTENKLRRLKEKYEDDIRYYQQNEEDYKNEQKIIKTEMLTLENIVTKLKKSLKQLQDEHIHMQKVSDNMSAEKRNLREILKQEFISEILMLKNALSAEQRKKEKELQDIYTRVKTSIARKDEQINKINEDNKTLHEKCKLLENIIEQQRRDYLMR